MVYEGEAMSSGSCEGSCLNFQCQTTHFYYYFLLRSSPLAAVPSPGFHGPSTLRGSSGSTPFLLMAHTSCMNWMDPKAPSQAAGNWHTLLA